jgi:predicted branched-subunit amino acid permease
LTARDLPPDASSKAALRAGYGMITSTPAMVFSATAIGFGALARDLDFSLGHALTISVTIFAMPAQVIMVDQLSRGAAAVTVAFLVALTAIRLLPMTVSLMPYLRTGDRLTPRHWLAAHLVVVTTWLEGNRLLPQVPAHVRLPYFIGLGLAILTVNSGGTILGFLAAGLVPRVLAAVLLFTTPMYFLVSLIIGATGTIDRLALALGLVLGPIFYLLTPGFDLLIAGVGGGTVAWALQRGRT